MEKGEISKATLGRIPMYLHYLDSLPGEVVNISAAKIARELGFGEVQVRKDLSRLCKSGKPKVGYDKRQLRHCLQRFLSTENGGAVLIGAGKLGQALLAYPGFETYGTEILAAFDTGVERAVRLPEGKEILPMDELEHFCQTHPVTIGIIATPAASAQSVLNRLYECGVKGIWCFAPCTLYTPADVTVQYENLALSLAHLKRQANPFGQRRTESGAVV